MLNLEKFNRFFCFVLVVDDDFLVVNIGIVVDGVVDVEGFYFEFCEILLDFGMVI